MERIVMSLGGSVIVPDDIDHAYLKKFREFILRQIKRGRRFVIVCGGGYTAKHYIEAASKIKKVDDEDLDWLGIHSTRLNGHLIRTIFRDVAHPEIITHPNEKLLAKEPVVIAAGWRPGCSTDYDAVLIARNIGARRVINITNTNYVYDKDPNGNGDAKPIKKISWADFRKLVGNKWNPKMRAPFDPIASREAQKLGMKAVITGKDLKNLELVIKGRGFEGTVIS